VMRVESGGHEYIGGQLTVSSAGAMGLMQLEPGTYSEMASQYGLGSDAFNPYDNIMAGTAYIHAMYQVYGSPGFLAAYDAGPGRLSSYMNGYTHSLPDETVNYVAMIAPHIQGYYPAHRSEADEMALNTMPMNRSGGLLPPGFVPDSPTPAELAAPGPDVQLASIAPPEAVSAPVPVQQQPVYASSALMAQDSLPPPPPLPQVSAPPAMVQTALVMPQALPPPPPRMATPERHSFSVIPAAMADTLPPPPPRPTLPSYVMQTPHHAGWAIQVGAYDTSSHAQAALGIAELSAVQMLMGGHPMVVSVHAEGHVKYRARFVGLMRDEALNACSRLSGGPTGCTVLSPDEQS
jgi:hypothetical protein